MGIISTEVEVGLASPNIKYYEDLGYEIPRIPKRGNPSKMVVKRGTKIWVKVEDLKPCCNINLEAECDCCGKRYSILKTNYEKINHDGLIYCNSCAKKLFNSGENNANYKSELTDEERDYKRIGSDYSNFIKRVLARDNYTCQCCKKHKSELDCELNVHHLDSYNWCKDKRIDDENGITLCENCHKNFHNRYGRGDNTKEQFEEWLGYTIELLKYNGEIIPTRQVYCYEENKIYKSVDEFCITHALKSNSSTYKVCNKEKKHVTVKGVHVFWHDEYLKMTQEEIESRINYRPPRDRNPVICLNTNTLYESIHYAAKQLGVRGESISNCCKRKQKNVYLKDGTKQQWMYYNEYLEFQQNNSNEDNIEHVMTEVA